MRFIYILVAFYSFNFLFEISTLIAWWYHSLGYLEWTFIWKLNASIRVRTLKYSIPGYLFNRQTNIPKATWFSDFVFNSNHIDIDSERIWARCVKLIWNHTPLTLCYVYANMLAISTLFFLGSEPQVLLCLNIYW